MKERQKGERAERKRKVNSQREQCYELYGQAPLPADVTPFAGTDFLLALATGALALAIYSLTIGPTVTGEDSGELITAAYTLGIPHPPGYPLWCMLGKLFTIIIPFKSISWRVGFMVAFLAAATVGAMTLVGIRLTRNRPASVSAALIFAFSYQFWKQGVIAEMYSLNAVTTILCILFLFVWYETRRNGLLYLFAVSLAFGLSNHHTMAFTAPLFALFILSVDRRPWLRWQVHLRMIGIVAAIWLCINLYLPIRAAANPPINWGNPSTWENFWDVVLRQQYVFGFSKNPRTIGRFVHQLGVFFGQYGFEFTPVLALLPLVGLYPLWKRGKRYLVFIAGAFVYFVLGFILIINFNIDKESIWVNSKFWIPAYMMAGLLMAPALAFLLRIKTKGMQLVSAAACLILPFLLLVANYKYTDKSDYYFARDFASNILKTLEPNAIYFPVADHATFPVLYLQAVEGQRPDVTIANKYGYTEKELYAKMPSELKTRVETLPGETGQAMIEDWILANTERPVCFTRKRQISGVPGFQMKAFGLLYKAVPDETSLDDKDVWSQYEWHSLDSSVARGEYTAEVVLADYRFFHGRYLLEQKDLRGALEDFRLALHGQGDTKEAMNNIGSACAEYGHLEQAAEYFTEALQDDPDYVLGMQNLAKVCMQQGQGQKAQPLLERLMELTPDDRQIPWMLVDCYKRLHQDGKALDLLSQMARVDPRDPYIPKEMGLIYLGKGDQQSAEYFLSLSLKLNPNQEDLLPLLNRVNVRPLPEEAVPGSTPNVPEIPMPEIPTPPIPRISRGP